MGASILASLSSMQTSGAHSEKKRKEFIVIVQLYLASVRDSLHYLHTDLKTEKCVI